MYEALSDAEPDLAPHDATPFEAASCRQLERSHPGLREAIRRLAAVAVDTQLNVRAPDPDQVATAIQNHGALLDAAYIEVLQRWLVEQATQ
jgi:hypothetical protein